MNKNLIISIITGVVVVGGVIWYFNSNSNYVPVPPESTMPQMPPSPQTAEPSTPPVPPPAPPTGINGSVHVYVGSVSVAIVNSSVGYSPSNITVKKGTTVTWTNQDTIKHNVMSDSGSTLSSPYLAKGESWSYTFNTVGTFSYHCVPHPWMKGTVTVVE